MTAPDHMLKKFEAYLHSREHPHMHAGPQAAPCRIARSSRTRAGSHVPPTITSNGWLAPARIPRASEVGLHRLPVLRQPPLAFHARPRCRGPGRCSQGRPRAAHGPALRSSGRWPPTLSRSQAGQPLSVQKAIDKLRFRRAHQVDLIAVTVPVHGEMVPAQVEDAGNSDLASLAAGIGRNIAAVAISENAAISDDLANLGVLLPRTFAGRM